MFSRINENALQNMNTSDCLIKISQTGVITTGSGTLLWENIAAIYNYDVVVSDSRPYWFYVYHACVQRVCHAAISVRTESNIRLQSFLNIECPENKCAIKHNQIYMIYVWIYFPGIYFNSFLRNKQCEKESGRSEELLPFRHRIKRRRYNIFP